MPYDVNSRQIISVDPASSSSAATETYAYPPTSNRLSTITTGTNIRTFSYLAGGQVSGDVRDPANAFTFAANDNGRNSSASLNGPTVGSYLYNAMEQRIAKTAGGSTIQFVYDSAGRLIEEADASTGTPIREYIWIDDLPLALIDDTGTAPAIDYIHTDQIGSPQKITDGSGALVWDGVFDPFGNQIATTIPITPPTNWGTAAWGSFNWAGIPLSTNPLRFPGQYRDPETQTSYNWMRNYDPSIGRYIQADPLADIRPAAISGATAPSTNPVPGGAATGVASLSLGQQPTLLAGLDNLRSTQQGPLGLRADFAASGNATTFPQDGLNLYEYARQSPLRRTDVKGLLPSGPLTPLPSSSIVDQCASPKKKYPVVPCPGIGGISCDAPVRPPGLNPDYPNVCYTCLDRNKLWPFGREPINPP